MALKAGYYGVKKAMSSAIQSMISRFGDALVIKSIGDGLELSEDDELSSEIKSIGDGLELSEGGELSAEIKSIGEGLALSEEGVLSSTSTGGVDYSNTEQNLGIKWTDGKSVYRKVVRGSGMVIPADADGTELPYASFSFLDSAYEIINAQVVNRGTEASNPTLLCLPIRLVRRYVTTSFRYGYYATGNYQTLNNVECIIVDYVR